MTNHVQHWTDLSATVSSAGVERREIHGAGVGLARLVVPAGTTAPPHSHAFEQFVHVVSGSGFLKTEQGRTAFAAGSVFHFPPGVAHAAEFETETVLVETNLPE